MRNIDSLRKDPDFDADLFKAKRNAVSSEIHDLYPQIEEANQEIRRLHDQKKQEDLLAQFPQDRQGVLRETHRKKTGWPAEGELRLLRALLTGPIVIKQAFSEAMIEGTQLKAWVDFGFGFQPIDSEWISRLWG